MQIVILGARGWHTDELCRASRARGHSAEVFPYEGLIARAGGPGRGDLSIGATAIFEADAVLARIIPAGSLDQVIYRVDALHWIETRGVPVMNSPRAIERSVDKFYTTALLEQAGLPTPETVVCEGVDDAMAAALAMGDVIVKPMFGSMGHGMMRVSDPDMAFRVFTTLEQVRAVFYLQRAVDHGGRDVRAFIVGGRAIAAIERRARDDWRTNVARGGRAEVFELPEEWERLAVNAAAVVGADYAGVDLLPSRDGQVFVLEVNGIPGWRALQGATGVDVADAIVDGLERRVGSSRIDTCTAPPHV
jgi:RimK family alpha-L-glutamate ligase